MLFLHPMFPSLPCIIILASSLPCIIILAGRLVLAVCFMMIFSGPRIQSGVASQRLYEYVCVFVLQL